jgi:hypothetical protein
MAENTFERIEKKYLLDVAQLRTVQRGLIGHMHPDPFGRSTISSIYYDTDDYRLIRTSLEKPKYKEKLRVRGYGDINAESTVFVELKKKYDGVVYKRRAELLLTQADALLAGEPAGADSQQGLRITFDDTLRFRSSALMMSAGSWGRPILPRGLTLMEIKASGAMPLWLCEILNRNRIYPTSFSKYGACYRDYLYPRMQQLTKGGSYA